MTLVYAFHIAPLQFRTIRKDKRIPESEEIVAQLIQPREPFARSLGFAVTGNSRSTIPSSIRLARYDDTVAFAIIVCVAISFSEVAPSAIARITLLYFRSFPQFFVQQKFNLAV